MDSATVVPPYVAKPLRLTPFRAAMLAPGRVGDPASARALARPYPDAAQRLAQWIGQGGASQDSEPALYLHEYTSGGLTVRGLVGLLDISSRATDLSDRAVWPHEAIHPEQATGLADRMERMQLNPAPILLVHDGSTVVREVITEVAQHPPDWKFVDRAGQAQRIWAIRDADALQRISAGLATTRCLLADGHHRYAAYLSLQERHPGAAWNTGLAMVVDQSDTPLFLGPIHRSLRGPDLASLEAAANDLGAVVTPHDRAEALNALTPETVVVTDGDRWICIQPPLVAGRTVVEWLHEDLLPRVTPSPQLRHHHDVDETLAHVGPRHLGVLLPSPAFDQVRDIVSSGRLLPEKATSFQPKPSLGVIMRRVGDV